MPGIAPEVLREVPWSSLNEPECFATVGAVVRHMRAKPMPTLVLGSLYLAGNVLTELGLDSDDDLSLLPIQG